MYVPEYGYPIVYASVGLGFLMSIIGLPSLLYFHDKSDVAAARSRFLLTCQWLGLNIQLIVMLMNFVAQPEKYCLIELIFWKIIIPQTAIILAFRGIRQLMIFRLSNQIMEGYLENVNSKTLASISEYDEKKQPGYDEEKQLSTIVKSNNQMEIEVEVKPGVPQLALFKRCWNWFLSLFPDLKVQVTDRYIIKVYLIVHIITTILPLISVIRIASDYKDNSECEDIFVDGWNYISGVIGILIDVIFIFTLRKIKDGFYLGLELVLLSISGILGLLVFLITFIPSLAWIGYLCVIWITDSIIFISYIFTSYKSWQDMRKLNSGDSSNSNRGSRKTMAGGEENDVPIFKNNPVFYKMLMSKDGYEAIGAFCLKYQAVNDICPMCMFIHKALAFREVEENLLDTEAFFIYQRFIKENAHYSVYLPEEIFEYYQNIFGQQCEGNTGIVTKNHFDQALGYIEGVLTEHFLDKFMLTPFYWNYLEKNKFIAAAQEILELKNNNLN